MLYESLLVLDTSYTQAQLGPGATVVELAEVSRDRVRIPIIDEAVYTREAVSALGAAILVLFIYLASLVNALEASINRKFEENAMDWIFFHPGLLGVSLGLIWLFFPFVIMLIAIIRQAVSLLLRIGLMLGLFAFAGWVFYKSMRVRKVVQRVLENHSQDKT